MEVTGKKISLFPTQHGFLFLGILVAMLLGSVNYNNNAGFILVFLLGSMAMISLAISYKNLIGLRLVPGHPSPVFAGEFGLFPVSITAPQSRGQALSVSIDHSGQAEKHRTEPVSIPSSGSIRTNIPFAPGSRGYRIPDQILLESVFPFGLFRLRTAIPNTAGILVYPSPYAGIAGTGFSGNRPDGEEETKRLGPDDFQGLSPYLPGSPVGHISWKTLSRGKGLFIKNFTGEDGRELLFDLNQTKGEHLEHRLSILCQALLGAEKNGYTYGLKLGAAPPVNPSSGSAHMHNCLKALALYEEFQQETP